jgi:superfamily II DNA/RNA helicase
MEKTPELSQRLLFSATLDGDVDTLVKRFLHDPVTHSVDSDTASVTTMEHHLLLIPPAQKFDIVASIAARKGRTIMFVRTQMAVDRLAEQLATAGVRAGALHGGKTQRVRTRTLAEFREGRMDVLVATDVAARGIHVDDVSLVVHIDPPKDSKDYLHRAGRTARAGESGMVVTLVMPRQRRSTFQMLERAGVKAGRTEVRLGAPELVELTGAQQPSGVPVRIDLSEPAPRARGGFGDRGHSGGGRPSRPFHGHDRGTDRKRDDRGHERFRDDRGHERKREDRGPYRQREGRPSTARHTPHRDNLTHSH